METSELKPKFKKSEDYYKLLIENSNDLIRVLDNWMKIEYINEKAHNRELGYTYEDLIGKNALNLIHHQEYKETRCFMRAVIKNGEAVREGRIKHKNGKWVWFEIKGKTFYANKNDQKFLFVCRNINERKKAETILKELNKKLEYRINERTKELRESEKQLRLQNEKLKKLDQLKTDFITIAAHELKTPLVPIFGFIELILIQYPNLSKGIANNLKKIQMNAERLKNYIDQLMDVMKIDAKKIDLILTNTNISDLIKKSVDTLKFKAKEKNIMISLDLRENLFLQIDELRITQVIQNLVLNAIKFTPINGHIKISMESKNNETLISVSDDGIGLTKDDINALFKKFVRLNIDPDKFSKNERGSGLGLYISKGIIKAHNGKIWVESEGKQKGSIFKVLLPNRAQQKN
ncbi:MAG: PAS domain-containing sensor histidine kinase [Promethearchaeota archaeon]